MQAQKKQPTRLKRLPLHSYTIIIKFENNDDKDKCIHSKDFKKAYGELASVLVDFNSRIETITWDTVSGTKRKVNKTKTAI